MKYFLILMSAAVIGLTGCVHERVIYRDRVPDPSDETATQEPPEVIQERLTIAPSPVHVWIGGRWAWPPGVWLRFGSGWRWRGGHWH
jgi:hypothetical protein